MEILNIFLKGSQFRSRPGQKSKSSLFELLVVEMGLMTAANPNFTKGSLKEWRKYHISIGFMLSKGQSQRYVKKNTEWKCCTSVVWHMFMGHRHFGFDSDIHSEVWPDERSDGQCQVKFSQIRQDFKTYNFLLKT